MTCTAVIAAAPAAAPPAARSGARAPASSADVFARPRLRCHVRGAKGARRAGRRRPAAWECRAHEGDDGRDGGRGATAARPAAAAAGGVVVGEDVRVTARAARAAHPRITVDALGVCRLGDSTYDSTAADGGVARRRPSRGLDGRARALRPAVLTDAMRLRAGGWKGA